MVTLFFVKVASQLLLQSCAKERREAVLRLLRTVAV